MKKLFLSLSILAQVVFSMEEEEVELDTKYTVEEYNKEVSIDMYMDTTTVNTSVT